MTWPTHIMAWLLIWHLTWDYVTAVACSFLVDVDHLLPIVKNWLLFRPKKIRDAMINPEVMKNHITWKKEDERNYLHSVFSFFILSALVVLISVPVGIVFTIAYGVHLIFDMLDKSDYYPFYPLKFINVKWFIRYFSKQELFFAFGLFVTWLILVFFNVKF